MKNSAPVNMIAKERVLTCSDSASSDLGRIKIAPAAANLKPVPYEGELELVNFIQTPPT